MKKNNVHWVQRIVYTILLAFSLTNLSCYLSIRTFDSVDRQVEQAYNDESDYIRINNISEFVSPDESNSGSDIYCMDNIKTSLIDDVARSLVGFCKFSGGTPKLPEQLVIYERPDDFQPDADCVPIMVGDTFVRTSGRHFVDKKYKTFESILHNIYGCTFEVYAPNITYKVCISDVFHIDGTVMKSLCDLSDIFFFPEMYMFRFASKGSVICKKPKDRKTLKNFLLDKFDYTIDGCYCENPRIPFDPVGLNDPVVYLIYFAIFFLPFMFFYLILLYVDIRNMRTRMDLSAFMIQNGIMLGCGFVLSLLMFLYFYFKYLYAAFPFFSALIPVLFMVLLFYSILFAIATIHYLRLEKKTEQS